MRIQKKIAAVALSALLMGGFIFGLTKDTASQKPNAEEKVTQKSLFDGDTVYKNHYTFVDYSLNVTTREYSTEHAMKAAQSFRSSVSRESRAVGRVFSVPAENAVDLSDMAQENLMFSF